MVDESEIRSHLAHSTMPPIAIDTDAVIARSKARRRPRQLAVGTVGVLAAASLVFAGVTTFPRTNDLTSAGIMADEQTTRMNSEGGADSAESYLAPEETTLSEKCGAIIPDTATSPHGLALEIDFPSPVAASGTAFGTVRLTNTSSAAVEGTTASIPDVNLIRDDVSISHSPDAQILTVVPVNLQPGQSLEFAVSVDIYDCTTIDSGGTLQPGTFAVSTSLAFLSTDPADGEVVEVRSPPKTIVLQ